MLEETSFAIQPGAREGEQGKRLRHLGKLKAYDVESGAYRFVCEGGLVRLRFYRPEVVRVTMHPFNEPDTATTTAVIKSPQPTEVELAEDENVVTLTSASLKVAIQKAPLRIDLFDRAGKLLFGERNGGMASAGDSEVLGFKDRTEADHFYGFGEKSGFLDKRDQRLRMWNSDVYAPHNPETDALYQSIPFFMTLREGEAYGLFLDNPCETSFDFKSASDRYCFSAKGGQLDYYLLGGPSPNAVLEQLTDLIGRMPLPPKWALGYHQSRYSYESESEVRELAETFREKGIPLDVIHLDIHYMRGFRVFTFDPERFPNPSELIADLRAKGIRAVPIVDPGVKRDVEYRIYQEGVAEGCFCQYLEGNLFFGDVWPGQSAFPDFANAAVRRWWGEKHRFYADLGIEGIWNDMNEPAVFNETKTMDLSVVHNQDGWLKSHRELHNLYGLEMSRATYEGMRRQLGNKRPFVLTRAGFAGIQRYAAVWTGDNRSFWEHLEMALPMVMNLGLSGVPFAGPDVGGFAHDATGQLLVRWTQTGALMPFFRNHSAIGTVRQEPWAFGERHEAIIKRYIQLRYEWLPHLYTLFEDAARTGLPVMRPLFMEYPEDSRTHNLSDQFLLGTNVMVAPIMRPDMNHRAVYFPSGDWVNYWTDEVIEGGRHHLIEAGLDTLPIFVRSGSIIPHGEPKDCTEAGDKRLRFYLFCGNAEGVEVSYRFYDDDGTTTAYRDGHYLIKQVQCEQEGEMLRIAITDEYDGFVAPWEQWELVLRGPDVIRQVIYNDRMLTPEGGTDDFGMPIRRLRL